jgi:hypothetical protein
VKLLIPRFEGAESVHSLLENVEFMTTLVKSNERRKWGQRCDQGDGSTRIMETKIRVLCMALRLLDIDLTHGSPPLGN